MSILLVASLTLCTLASKSDPASIHRLKNVRNLQGGFQQTGSHPPTAFRFANPSHKSGSKDLKDGLQKLHASLLDVHEEEAHGNGKVNQAHHHFRNVHGARLHELNWPMSHSNPHELKPSLLELQASLHGYKDPMQGQAPPEMDPDQPPALLAKYPNVWKVYKWAKLIFDREGGVLNMAATVASFWVGPDNCILSTIYLLFLMEGEDDYPYIPRCQPSFAVLLTSASKSVSLSILVMLSVFACMLWNVF